MIVIDIPGADTLALEHVVCDFNGTLAIGAAHVVASDIRAALDLLLNPRRLAATLRR